MGWVLRPLVTWPSRAVIDAHMPAHFLGIEVELGPAQLPWLVCALFMSSTASINAAVWLQAELPATQVQLP